MTITCRQATICGAATAFAAATPLRCEGLEAHLRFLPPGRRMLAL